MVGCPFCGEAEALKLLLQKDHACIFCGTCRARGPLKPRKDVVPPMTEGDAKGLTADEAWQAWEQRSAHSV